MNDGYPELPTEALEDGGWERRVRSTAKVFETPTVEIVGHTLLYDDAALREAMDAAGYGDLLTGGGDSGDRMIDTGEDGGHWRFFFATALSFRPPLAPGVGPASMRPQVVSQARRAFAEDLRARGFEGVERGRSQRVRTESRDRASLQKVTASYPLGPDAPADSLDVEGWIGVWTVGGAFRIAGGAYPVRGVEALLGDSISDLSTDPTAYRNELLDLIRAVE